MLIAFFVIILYLRSLKIRQFNKNEDSKSIFIIFHLNLTIWFSCIKTWVDVYGWVLILSYVCFLFNFKKEK